MLSIVLERHPETSNLALPKGILANEEVWAIGTLNVWLWLLSLWINFSLVFVSSFV